MRIIMVIMDKAKLYIQVLKFSHCTVFAIFKVYFVEV